MPFNYIPNEALCIATSLYLFLSLADLIEIHDELVMNYFFTKVYNVSNEILFYLTVKVVSLKPLGKIMRVRKDEETIF